MTLSVSGLAKITDLSRQITRRYNNQTFTIEFPNYTWH